jgi:hypothetical protein
MATYLPGAEIPNYTLSAPNNPQITIYNNSSTVENKTLLSELIKPYMGPVQWAACTECKVRQSMYFRDLTNYSYYQIKELSNVQNIGWLDKEHSFCTGKVTHDCIKKIRHVIAGSTAVNVHVNNIRGIHPCNLCGEDAIKIEGRRGEIFLGSSEIWLPTNEGYFASPSMILHYIEDHDYLPPQQFIDAVMLMNMEKQFNGQQIYDNYNKA